MRTKSHQNEEIDMLAAAVLYCRHGLSQKQIHARLRIPAVKVHRLLKQAKAEGRVKLQLDDLRWTKETRSRVEARICNDPAVERWRHVLLAKYSPFLKSVNVLRPQGSDRESALAEFTDLASPQVLGLIRRSRFVGIAWGVTISSLVNSLRKHAAPAKTSKRPIEFVPLIGEPLGVDDLSGLSSSRLARELDLLLNGGESHSPSLRGIADIIPWEVPRKELPTILRFLEQVSAYRRVFGCPSRVLSHDPLATDTHGDLLINQLDCVVTSISKDRKPWRISDASFMRTGRLRRNTLENLVVGDIAGVLIPREAALRSPERKRRYHQLIERWTGAKLPHLQKCASMAAQDIEGRRPGVIALCAGKEKMENLVHVLNQNLVNHLIVDYELAKQLVDRRKLAP